MTRDRLADLEQLLEMRLQASQAKLREITDREEHLVQLLNSLTTQRAAQAEPRSDQTSILAMQVDIRHLKWIDQRRAAIYTERAQLRALIEMARSDLRTHFARHTALQKVYAKKAAARQQRAQRKRDYGS